MTKRLIHLLLICMILMPALASAPAHKDGKKQMKTIREQLKNKKAADALKSIEKLREDSAYCWNPQLLQYGVEACKMLNDKENEKFYLKSKPDTVAFFNTTYNIIQYILLTDSAERLSAIPVDTINRNAIEANEPIKFKYRKTNKEILSRTFKNFVAAPLYFNAHGKWEETERYTALAIDLATSPFASSYKRPLYEPEMIRDFAVMHLNSCYRLSKFVEIEKYANFALQDSAKEESIIEKLAYAEIQRADSASYLQSLERGHSKFPANMFFFSRLVDVNLHLGNNNAVLSAANQTLEYVLHHAQDEARFCVIDTTGTYAQPSDGQALIGVRTSVTLPSQDIAQIFEARAIAHHNNNHPRECIEDAENILSWNPEHPRANFYIGVSYYSMAEGIEIPGNVSDRNYNKATRERNRLLALARPHLETYRLTSPNDSAIWAPLLYETYLYLNLGPEFEEISKYIN